MCSAPTGIPGVSGADEADRIYRAIFGASVPDVIRDRFARPSALLESTVPAEEFDLYRRIVAGGADLEAAEVAARLSGRLALLPRKFQLMVHLAETIPANQHYFINTRDSRVLGYAVLAWSAVRTIIKLSRGLWILRGATRA